MDKPNNSFNIYFKSYKEAIDIYEITKAYAIHNKIGPLNSAKNNLSK